MMGGSANVNTTATHYAGCDGASAGGGAGPCGACKFLRRKCARGCIFAPHFDAEGGAVHFAAVHRVFGASNASKLLQRVPPHRRSHAVLALCYEAHARLRDPVYGCVAHIFALQQQLGDLEAEISLVHAQLALLHHHHQAASTQRSQQNPTSASAAPPPSAATRPAATLPSHFMMMTCSSSSSPSLASSNLSSAVLDPLLHRRVAQLLHVDVDVDATSTCCAQPYSPQPAAAVMNSTAADFMQPEHDAHHEDQMAAYLYNYKYH